MHYLVLMQATPTSFRCLGMSCCFASGSTVTALATAVAFSCPCFYLSKRPAICPMALTRLHAPGHISVAVHCGVCSVATHCTKPMDLYSSSTPSWRIPSYHVSFNANCVGDENMQAATASQQLR